MSAKVEVPGELSASGTDRLECNNECLKYPTVIQGGMGVAVSSWRLAREVSQAGQLGFVSGTGIDTVMTRRLQLGDIGGHMRRAFEAFPIPGVAERIWQKFYIPGGKGSSAAYKSKPMPGVKMSRALKELIVLASFCEIFLAKEGHNGVVGLNLLEKLQVPTLPSLYGAMLAGVDYVEMGAGIPLAIPGVLDCLARLEPVELKLNVVGALPSDDFSMKFDPREFAPVETTELKRPKFLAVIASATLATTLVRRATGKVDGFIIEGNTAGGHNAPPRGKLTLNDKGEPVYGPRDDVDLEQIKGLGLPFWLAGSYATPERLQFALSTGAQGIQVGTAFAFCDESGMKQDIRLDVIKRSLEGTATIRTDPLASPTGFPFKVVEIEGTFSDPSVLASRKRICDLGYLRTLYRTEKGEVAYRCPAEPEEDFVDKGGHSEEVAGRTCLCNGLLGTIGLSQIRKGVTEPAIITAGDEVLNLRRYIKPGFLTYSARDVLTYLLAGTGI